MVWGYLCAWFVVEASAVLFHYSSACAVWKWGKDVSMQQQHPLPDVFHQGLHPKQRLRPLVYFPLAVAQSAMFLGPFLAMVGLAGWHHHLAQTLCLACACHAPLLVCRALSFRSTLLPDVTQEFKLPRPLHGATYDLIFSGHTMFALVPTYIMVYFGWLHPFVLALLVLLNIVNGAGIIWFRRHYTVDVWLAWLITTLFFYFAVTSPAYRLTWCFSSHY